MDTYKLNLIRYWAHLRFAVALFATTFSYPSLSQDGHYWTQQYGTRSILLSGSIIGGVNDLGAVYYNPGRLAVISNSAFLLSASVYEYNAITISNAFGVSQSASKSEIKGVPNLAAGTFKVGFLPKHFFAYAIQTRQNTDLSFSYRNEVHKDVFATLAGDEWLQAEVGVSQKSSDVWTGVTWSYPISPKYSVGVTTNFSTNTQSIGSNINLQALSQSDQVAMYKYNRSFSYTQYSLLWKAGLAASLGKWELGLTVTTPSLKLSGKGSYTFEHFFSTIPGLTTVAEQYSTSFQDDLETKNRTPWAIGFGATRLLGRNKLHMSTEWFSAISQYTMMSAASHVSQSNPLDTIGFQLVDQAKSVLNAGIGMEFYLSKSISGFASFSTDFSAVTNGISRFLERQDQASASSWNVDFYHLGGGIMLNLKGADLTIGATHTGASREIPRPVNFPENSGQNIFSTSDTADFRWDRWRLIFSFSFPFLKDYEKKLTGEKDKK